MYNPTKLRELKSDLVPFNFDWTGFGSNEDKTMEQMFNALKFYKNMGVLDLRYTCRIDRRTSKRAGVCNYGKCFIGVSHWLIRDNPLQEVENTIKHEIAHAIAITQFGREHGRGHGYVWKTIARAIGDDGERCYSSATVKNTTKSKWTLKTDCCGSEIKRHKLSEKMKRGVTRGTVYATCCKHLPRDERRVRIIQNY